MTTFNGDKRRKADYLARADQLALRLGRSEKRESLYFSNNCWCEATFVCQRQQCNHNFYAEEVGVPVALAYAERALFLNLSERGAAVWPRRFLNALPVGLSKAGLEEVCRQFAEYLLTDPVVGLYGYAVTPQHYEAIGGVIELYRSRSTDVASWELAAQRARRASFDDERGKTYSVRDHHRAGAMACSAAAYLAEAHRDPRRFADAVSWAPWAARYKLCALLMAQAGENIFSRDRCESAGERRRQEYYGLHSDKLLELIARQSRREGHGPLGWLTTRLAHLMPVGPTGNPMRHA